MAGSQLKQLKAALKSNGLIGQTNIKKKNKKSKTPSETRRNDTHEILNNIRRDFNQFDNKVNRTKRDVTTIQGGKFVKVGSKQHNDATKTNSNIENSLRMQYDLDRKQRGRTGGLVDRRFGENNRHLSAEEKMLERFTRERQGNKKKVNFALNSDDEQDDDDDGFVLTHSGKTLALDKELDNGDLGASNTKYYDEDSLMPEDSQPKRKSKQEVMKEVIAKSKFYKHQRQMEHQKTQDDIVNLDDEFGDIMTEIGSSSAVKAPKFSSKTPEEIEYDNKVRELTYDRRSVPADRTKTEEELQKEHNERVQKLETDRLRRMNGEDDERNAEADDLDGFWDGSDNDEDGFSVDKSEEDQEEESGSDEDIKETRTSGRTLKTTVSMPATHEEFVDSLSSVEESKHCSYIKKIIEIYQPRLAQGNKERMNIFVGILFQHILFLSNNTKPQAEIVDEMMKILKKLSESYNEKLVESVRTEINEIQERIFNLQPRDLVFFSVIGYLFSTSDHYHLVVTPTLILMNENISNVAYNKETTVNQIGQGIFIADMLLNYESFSKRYIPELVCFLEKALLLLVPEPNKLSNKCLTFEKVIKSSINLTKNGIKPTNDLVRISELFGEDSSVLKMKLINRVIDIIDRLLNIWRDKSTMVEILGSFGNLTKHLANYYDTPKLLQLIEKMDKVQANLIKERKPLALQHHKALAIATFAPKFEENFNPDKKSYDVNRERQELNKIKNEIKKERKSTLKDIRKESKFTARQQIKEKKDKYDDYHKKMANIVNSISTIEGAEKNTYEREKQKRKNR